MNEIGRSASQGPACPPRSYRLRGALCRSSGVLAITALLLLGVVAGASAQESDAPQIVDFEQIQATPITFDFDPSGQAAILNVDTTLDLACAVVYGTDETFGQIATDQDMNGGAHANHHPVMGGLEPDTEYRFRLQGSGADGVIYMSDTMTFRTPAALVAMAPNLSLGGQVVEVSSEWSDAFAAANAFDGDPTTEWSSRGDGDGAYVTIDLGGPEHIDAVEFRTRSMGDGSAITDMFRVTVDGQEFGPFPTADGPAAVGTTGQVVRIEAVSTTGGNTGAVEIEILGPSSEGS